MYRGMELVQGVCGVMVLTEEVQATRKARTEAELNVPKFM